MNKNTAVKALKISQLCFLGFVLAAYNLAQAETLDDLSKDQNTNFDVLDAEEDLFADESFVEENLFADDEMGDELVLEEFSESNSWLQNLNITLQQTFLQGEHLEISRSEARVEYEIAPWDGAYFRIDNKYTFYGENDQQVGVEGSAFGHNKLQEAWLQLSQSSCVGKLGRQGLSWGVIEGAFAVDVVSPFDFTEPLLTDYSNVRLSQDMLLADCYFSNTQVQSFYVTSARLNIYRQRNNAQLQALENTLHDEFGARITQRWEGFDVSLMYAHLYGNEPLTIIDIQQVDGVRLAVSRYDFVGFSVAWAIGRLLLELDLGYKHNELENFSGKENSHKEVALGLEYTTSSNHQLNTGVWVFDEVLQSPTPLQKLKRGSVQAWTFGWAKTYLKDDLAMSFLGSWITESEVLRATLLAQYQWDDYWNFSTGLTYTDAKQVSEELPLEKSDLTVLLKAKLEF